MPAADLGSENPLPPLKSGRVVHADFQVHADIPEDMRRNFKYGHLLNILPYTMQDGYNRQRKPREFRVAVLENDILRATFLLELGGRLWSLYHKPTQRELLTVNPVFQPANLALRNAWFSGGVEWNIGTIGHTPFTCAPLFAARVEGPNGLQVLRMYEWERIRQTPFQIDAWLPDGSPVLFVRVRILNPHDHQIPMYWWSNIAVRETEDTRVIVPSEKVYFFNYKGLEINPVPEHDGTDNSYPTRIGHACDFFFHIPENQRPWIAALDKNGQGLVQVSTNLLKGRKLFVWGMNAGGRKWQEFLSPNGEPYIEIQAGLARTQLEHLPMPPGEWTWLEAYGLLESNSNLVHGKDWGQAQQAVETSLAKLISQPDLEAEFEHSFAFADTPPSEIWQRGSGWGALENLRRQADNEKPFCSSGMTFDETSLREEQAPWLELLRTGQFPAIFSSGLMVQAEWKTLLEDAAPKHPNWFAWLHLGVMRYYAGDTTGARRAWEASLAYRRTHWALRNLAVLAKETEEIETTAALYAEALRMRPDLLPLAVECGKALIEAGFTQRWLDLLPILSPTIRSGGRIRLLEAEAALKVGDLKRVEIFLENKIIVDDVREGEESLSNLWHNYHAQRISRVENTQLNEALLARVRREYPVPSELDFRMSDRSS
jgi:hypothetical protein